MAPPRKYADWCKYYQSWTFSAMQAEYIRLFTASLSPADASERVKALHELLNTVRGDVERAMRNTNGCS